MTPWAMVEALEPPAPMSSETEGLTMSMTAVSHHQLDSSQDPFPGLQITTPTEPLSERECEVLELVATGRSNQEIADELYLSINTIKTYIRAAYRKIGASSRSQAVIWVLRREDDPGGGPPTLRVVAPEGSSR